MELSPSTWQLWSVVALSLVMTAALISDLRQRRIPNPLVLVALVAGLLAHLAGPANGAGGLFAYWPGSLGARGAVLGALTGLLVFLPIYLLRAMGAGDVKLMAGIGSFAGPADTLNLALCMLAMGGVVALGRMAWKGNSRKVLGNVVTVLLPPVSESGQRLDPATRSADRMPYVPAMAGGLLAYGGWRLAGGAPWIPF